MATIYVILLLIVFATIATIVDLYILNIAGIPGALIAGKPGIRSKSQFIIGSIISSLGQSYINLAYTAFIVSWTMFKVDNGNVVKFIVWIFAFIAVISPIWKTYNSANREEKEKDTKYGNPQVEALILTALITLIGFFIFVFVPTIMSIFWSWVPYVSK